MARKAYKDIGDSLALMLAQGKSLRESAEALGVNLSTVQRRAAESTFQKRVAELRGEMLQAALGQLSDAMSAAAGKLRELLEAAPPTVVLSAARSLLEFGIKIREHADLSERVSALERLAKGEGDEPEEDNQGVEHGTE